MIETDELETESVLELAAEYADEHGIEDVVVASTSGATGEQAAEIFDLAARNLTVVGHAVGYSEPNEQEFDDRAREAIEAAGGTVFLGPMVFSNVGAAIKDRDGFSAHELVADVLRLFGQGTKVTLECVLAACDAGHVPAGKTVLAVAGTGDGADTVLAIKSANSRDLFEARILNVIAKPSDPENLFYW
ncbi:hypothetical protein HTSR_1192 [Halodesulfurarchaeum formicicum]|uniref:Uncharacterized protein n=1 Tax=Halodesulfurarchaeum formicicum TaxID=1873524 RepID=A0A1D8S4U9_9EURY|nr:pyruvate kinase alpha/beta domain-containing protein [Halodesulfurarchaeum formicicum]AOW80372.1 hypothetical protein HTSR_1192 [Halodesulfurarchaeum formicicum]APE95675.1 hypothetical protein HSR6_1227 [Halodesulfurarchaeum formicicum]